MICNPPTPSPGFSCYRARLVLIGFISNITLTLFNNLFLISFPSIKGPGLPQPGGVVDK